ncbi:MAG: hypothetical protein DI589_11725 [Shinella sp.]|nr:MAG: hypothetical protein DI589_11725 [Shinella sp.]
MRDAAKVRRSFRLDNSHSTPVA